jgi:hypothetical protein
MALDIIGTVERFHATRPFHPFCLVLDDDSRVTIEQPEFIGWFPSRDRISYSTPDDTTEVLAVSRIKRVEAVRDRGRDRKRKAG